MATRKKRRAGKKKKLLRRFRMPAVAALAGVSMKPIDPAEFEDRKGYDPQFLGAAFAVPLPKLTDDQSDDAVRITGSAKFELKYENFSVVQSKKRRMCYYSACNIDGNKSRKVKRSNTWRFDGRIPTALQIIEECYGDATDDMFSRGHMTRREDPVHGTPTRAKIAERDTFTVTNAVPQMQAHNSPVWLGIEDYVLKNSREDRQRVSVFTGPVFRANDPILFGVRIPMTFWKVIAFIHDDTGQLAAAAYRDSQAEFVPDADIAFVFGKFKEMQVTVRAVEKMSKLKFGPLVDVDVLADADMSFAMTVEKPSDAILR